MVERGERDICLFRINIATKDVKTRQKRSEDRVDMLS